MVPHHVGDNGGRGAHRFLPDVNRRAGSETPQPVVVDNLQYLRFFNAFCRLTPLVVIHQDDLLPFRLQHHAPVDDSDIFSLSQHRIGYIFGRKDFFLYIRQQVRFIEADHRGRHDQLRRNALVDQPRRAVTVKGRNDNHIILCFRQPDNFLRNRGIPGQHQTDAADSQQFLLHIFPVPQDNHIPWRHIRQNRRRLRRAQLDLAGKGFPDIPAKQPAFQRADNIGIADGTILQFPDGFLFVITFGQIAYSDDAGHISLCVQHRHGLQPGIFHKQLACFPQRSLHAHGRRLQKPDIFQGRIEIINQTGRRNFKIIQHKLRFWIQLARPGRFRIPALLLFQIGIGNSRADRVGIRMLVTDDKNRFIHNCLPDTANT